LRARIAKTLPELLALRAQWDRLLAASAETTPWQGFDFISRWWQHLGAGLQLRVVVVERDGEPCLILPLQISSLSWLGALKLRVLEPIGSLMDVNRPRLALGKLDEAAYACALEAIWAASNEWDAIRIDEKTDDDSEVEMLRRFAQQHGCRFRQIFSHLIPWLDLQQDWDSFLAGRSSKMRKNLRAGQRKLEKLGPVSLHDYRSPQDIATGLAIVHELHAHSWKGKEKIEHSESVDYRSFYAGWLQAMTERGGARILVMCCGDTPVAATIAITEQHTYYSAQIVHDSRYAACSPGTLLEAQELEGLMGERQFARYDMLGSFLNNKMRWTDSAESTTLVFVLQPALRSWLFDAWFFRIKPRLRPHLMWLQQKLRGGKN
jgi:CelD/BcsL family acetyltransferase involved in cellulose biosynthesis